jgi:hypothetical protein
MRRWLLASPVLVVAAWGLEQPARAGEPAGAARAQGLAEMWRSLGAAIDRAAEANRRRPPAPVPVTWRERRLASLDLGAPLLAVAAADLDGNGRAELIALTRRDLVVLAAGRSAMVERARAELGGEPAAIRPRDPVGLLLVDRRADEPIVWARSSDAADAVGFAWRRGQLAALERAPGFPVCPGGSVELAPGRNMFTGGTASWQPGAAPGAPMELPAEFLAAGCRGAVDPTGRPLSLTGVVDMARVLRVTCRAEGGAACPDGPAQDRTYDGVGVAFELADIDSDGHPEVLVTRGGAPGDRDRVTVYSRRGDTIGKVFAKEFHAGVVAVVAADIDGDRDRDVVVAVRFAGSTQVSFWTLNQ